MWSNAKMVAGREMTRVDWITDRGRRLMHWDGGFYPVGNGQVVSNHSIAEGTGLTWRALASWD